MSAAVDPTTGAIDYDFAITLDAEELAELGVAAGYAELAPHLAAAGVEPRPPRELTDSDNGEYAVVYEDRIYRICGPDLDDDSWGRATHALFDIVNTQLSGTGLSWYAINGGNDLHAILLTDAEAALSRRALPRRQDWPYLPTDEPPWFGAFTDPPPRRGWLRR